MNKTTYTARTSFVVLLAGLAAAGVLMFAFSQNAEAKDGKGPKSVGSSLEVMLSDNGNAVVRGAEVTAVGDGTITARTVWNAASLTWTVETDGSTQYVEKSGRGTSRSEIRVGDYVSFSGTIDDSKGAFTVDADVVKNWSKDSTASVLTGVVTDIDGDELTIRIKNDTLVTVETGSGTTFAGGAFADIDEGDRIVVSGSYDASAKVIDATKISLNLGAAIKPVVTDWKNWMKDMPVFNWFKKDNR